MDPKIKALIEQINSGKAKSNREKVLLHIKQNPHTTIEVMRIKFGKEIPHQTLTSVISWLMDRGLIYVSKKKDYSHYVYEENVFKHEIHARQMEKTKFINWKDRGMKQFSHLMTPELNFQLKYSKY